MKIEFKTSFERDIKKIIDNEILSLIESAIENVENAKDTREINNFRKLTGYKTYYRIKVKDYRIGLNIIDNTIYFVRFLHRKDIYKVFP